MSDTSAEAPRGQLDELKIAKGVALGLPLVTVTLGALALVMMGPATAVLVLAAGLLLGVIAIFWASLRVLSGDAPLAPELESLDLSAQGVDALASRKKMLLRALKDLENERALGKLEEEDYAQVSATYRAELKELLRRIDATLEPHRAKAEELARAHLRKAGLAEVGYRGAPPPREASTADEGAPAEEPDAGTSRRTCPKCKASNEPDAKFCKECATALAAAAVTEEETSDEE